MFPTPQCPLNKLHLPGMRVDAPGPETGQEHIKQRRHTRAMFIQILKQKWGLSPFVQYETH